MAKRKRGRSSGGSKVVARVRGVPKAFGHALGPHKADAYGVGLALAAVLFALGIWLHAAGPVGAFFELAARGLLGQGGYLAPIALGYLAFAFFTTRPGPDRPRAVVGLIMVMISSLGLWHLASGTPDVTAGAEKLRAAGGLVGAIVAGPLVRLLAAP